jgi:hypothetical protein
LETRFLCRVVRGSSRGCPVPWYDNLATLLAPTDGDGSQSGTGQGQQAPPLRTAVDFERNREGKIITDKRQLTRRAKERERRVRLERERKERLDKENAVLAIAAGGGSYTFIGQELGITPSYARRLYLRARERVGQESMEEFIAQMDHRHAVLLQSTWGSALQGDKEDRRDALKIMDQWTKLRGGYPAVPVELSGDVTVRREISLTQITELVIEIQAERIARGEAEFPQLSPAQSNGHGNGHAPSIDA